MIGLVSGLAVFVFMLGVASLDDDFRKYWTEPLRRYTRRGRHRHARKLQRRTR